MATDTAAPFTFTLTNVAAGSYTFTARATDNLGATTTSTAVSVTVNAAAQLFFIHTDHLNTPRLITNNAGQAVWRWDQTDPFGGNPPNENPSGLGTFTCNLRLPGQYFDQETNTHYNYYRDYDPSIGRYIQSDPIGLEGGINTYIYVNGNPVSIADPLGLLGRGSGPQNRPGYPSNRPNNSPWYGRYCGPGNLPGDPIDCVDAACREHDICYKLCDVRAGTRLFPNTFDRCALVCDFELIRDYRKCKDEQFCRPAPSK